MFVQAVRGLVELLWPPRTTCLLCNGVLTDAVLPLVCGACSDTMVFDPTVERCSSCNRPKLGTGSELCSECESGSGFGKAWALGLHTGALREAIHHLKFNGREELGVPLGNRLGAQVADRFDGVLPVPLHRSRLRERGYNQAEAIAIGVASYLGLPLWAGALARTRSTGHQAKLDRSSRLQNLQSAFLPTTSPAPWLGKAVLVVDDVLTTGSTATAVCNVLLSTGAARVGLAVLAVSMTPVAIHFAGGASSMKIPINKSGETIDTLNERSPQHR